MLEVNIELKTIIRLIPKGRMIWVKKKGKKTFNGFILEWLIFVINVKNI